MSASERASSSSRIRSKLVSGLTSPTATREFVHCREVIELSGITKTARGAGICAQSATARIEAIIEMGQAMEKLSR